MEWSFATTSVVTGELFCDHLAFVPESIKTSVVDPSEISGSIPKDSNVGFYAGKAPPRKSMLWAKLDGRPYAAGVIWNRDARSAVGGVVQLKARGLQSLFDKRRIDDTLTYTNVDPLDIFRSILSYTLSKPYGGIANLTVGEDLLGTSISMTYNQTDRVFIRPALDALAAANGFEWDVVPYLTPEGTLALKIVFGVPQLTGNSALTLSHPGDVLDYDWPAFGTDSANSVLAIGNIGSTETQLTSAVPHGQLLSELQNGYPLLESVQSFSGNGVIDVNSLNALADSALGVIGGDAAAPTLSVALSNELTPWALPIGWKFNFALTSDYHPAINGLPGLCGQARLIDITINPGEFKADLSMGDIA